MRRVPLRFLIRASDSCAEHRLGVDNAAAKPVDRDANGIARKDCSNHACLDQRAAIAQIDRAGLGEAVAGLMEKLRGKVDSLPGMEPFLGRHG